MSKENKDKTGAAEAERSPKVEKRKKSKELMVEVVQAEDATARPEMGQQ